jgi:hypothetical protein
MTCSRSHRYLQFVHTFAMKSPNQSPIFHCSNLSVHSCLRVLAQDPPPHRPQQSRNSSLSCAQQEGHTGAMSFELFLALSS